MLSHHQWRLGPNGLSKWHLSLSVEKIIISYLLEQQRNQVGSRTTHMKKPTCRKAVRRVQQPTLYGTRIGSQFPCLKLTKENGQSNPIRSEPIFVHPNHGFNFNFVSVVQVKFSCSFESCFFQGLNEN